MVRLIFSWQKARLRLAGYSCLMRPSIRISFARLNLSYDARNYRTTRFFMTNEQDKNIRIRHAPWNWKLARDRRTFSSSKKESNVSTLPPPPPSSRATKEYFHEKLVILKRLKREGSPSSTGWKKRDRKLVRNRRERWMEEGQKN